MLAEISVYIAFLHIIMWARCLCIYSDDDFIVVGGAHKEKQFLLLYSEQIYHFIRSWLSYSYSIGWAIPVLEVFLIHSNDI